MIGDDSKSQEPEIISNSLSGPSPLAKYDRFSNSNTSDTAIIDYEGAKSTNPTNTELEKRTITINYLKEGHYFGEISLLTRMKRTMSVKAIDKCTLSTLD